MAVIEANGMTMTIANERQFGTLLPLLATPASRIALFLGRSLPVIVNALVVSTFGFAVGLLLLDFSLGWSQVPPLAVVVAVTVASCTALGMLLGSIGLRARDVFFASNLVYFLMLLVCGVNIDVEVLPGWLEAVGRAVPLTHGIEAAREVVRGEGLGEVGDLVLTELAIGITFAASAFVLFRLFEFEGRRRASLETF